MSLPCLRKKIFPTFFTGYSYMPCNIHVLDQDSIENAVRYLYFFLHNAQMQKASATSKNMRSVAIEVKVPIAKELNFHPVY